MQDSPSGESKPKPYTTGPLPGGELPEIGKLFNETLAEFMDNIGPYALAGVGQLLVVVPLTVVSIFLLYGVVVLGFFGSFALTTVLVGVLANVSEDLAALVAAFGSLGSMFVPLLLLFPMILLMVAVLAPLQASLYRAVAAHQRGEKPLDLSASFSTATQGLVGSVMAACIVTTLVLIGLMLCYLPALLVPLFFGFTMGFVALHGMGAVQSARTSLQHSLAHLNWHIVFALVGFVLNMFASYIPVVGPMFAVALHVRAYRYVFGDGAEAVLH